MQYSLSQLFDDILVHRAEHGCGAYPYEQSEMLGLILKKHNAKRILELGIGLGYSSICMLQNNKDAILETIDQDDTHIAFAKENWKKFGVAEQSTSLYGKAEDVLKKLSSQYDAIFFDGYAPSMKFLMQFERLLKKGGLLITANLFLRDITGGKYVRALKKEYKWQTLISGETAISVKL